MSMDPAKFLKEWEKQTGLYLVGETRRSFLKECDQVLYLEPRHLKKALRTAGKTGAVGLKYIETVALNVRAQNTRDNVIDFVKARQTRRHNES